MGKLNRLAGIDYPDDPALRARIKSYELAYGMQTAVPETLRAIDKLWGQIPGQTKSPIPHMSGERAPRANAAQPNARLPEVWRVSTSTSPATVLGFEPTKFADSGEALGHPPLAGLLV